MDVQQCASGYAVLTLKIQKALSDAILMRAVLITCVALCLSNTVAFAAERPKDEPLIWCGLDYAKVKMIGTADFRQPEQIFPGMLNAWNGLFMKEMLPEIESMAKIVRTDLAAVTERNSKATASQIERRDGTRKEMVNASHLTEPDIAEIVASYKLEQTNGLGLVYIMDRLVKNQDAGCLYVVFFDVQSRAVVRSERMCGEAGGIGFRNYWFTPVKEAVEKTPKMYKKARKGEG